MDDHFGHWLAGFADGEGCFCISATGNGAGRVCSFSIALRADDRALLDEIQRQTGLGRVYMSPGRGSTKPYCRWHVQKQADAREVVRIFERYPLRGKKAADFTIWKQAVAVLSTGGQGRPAVERWPIMDRLRIQLQAVRAFDHDAHAALLRELDEMHDHSDQLRLADIA